MRMNAAIDMSFCRLSILILVPLLCCSYSSQVRAADEAAYYGEGLALFDAGQFREATRAWEDASQRILAQSKQPQSYKDAGLAQVLVAIALEKSDDARSYEAWGKAVQFFLQGASSWEDTRGEINARIETLTRQLSATAADVGSVRVSEDDVTLLSLQESLSLNEYRGPRANLPSVAESPNAGAAINVARDYHARPLVVINAAASPSGPVLSRRAGTPITGRELGNTVTTRAVVNRVVPDISTNAVRDEPVQRPVKATKQRSQPQRQSPGPTFARPAVDAFTLTDNTFVANGAFDSFANNVAFATQAPQSPSEAVSEAGADGEELLAYESGDYVKTNIVARPETSESFSASPESKVETHNADRRGTIPIAEGSATRSRQTAIPINDTQGFLKTQPSDVVLPSRNPLVTAKFGEQEREIARTAWRYFLNNRQQNTGLFNSVSGYTYTTMWGVASSIAALVCAEQIGLIESGAFHKQAQLLLITLNQIALYNDELPNREYDTRSGKMVDFRIRESHQGSGWSAIDIGRLLIWLKIVSEWYPDLAASAEAVVARWRFTRLSRERQLNGAFFNGEVETLYQEGRFGYEHYAARGFALWNIAVPNAQDYDDVAQTEILGLDVPHDKRDFAFLTNEPFVLGRLELGATDVVFDRVADILYLAHKSRWKQYDILSAVSEDAIDEAPWFLYNNVYKDNKSWVCTAANGELQDRCASVSAKVAHAWSVLYADDYAKTVQRAVKQAVHPKFGFFAGLYNDGSVNEALSINTNAVILEAMLYRLRGGAFLQRSNEREG